MIAVAGLLVVPLLHTLGAAQTRKRAEATAAALAAGREALLAYAARHRGCLPLAADFEGGLPDTGLTGTASASTVDTGSMRSGILQRAGDLPWADLGLGGRALDGQQLRLQYFIASAATDPAQLPAGRDDTVGRNGCPLRTRAGIESWQPNTAYSRGDLVTDSGRFYVAASSAAANVAPPAAPWTLFGNGSIAGWSATTSYTKGDYVSSNGVPYRALGSTTGADPALSPQLWRAVGLPGMAAVPAWQAHASEGYRRGELVAYGNRIFRAVGSVTSPALAPVTGASGPDWEDLSLPDRLLQTRLGPAVGSAPGSTMVSAQNIAILIAPGRGTNTVLNRSAVRDANHLACASSSLCGAWTTLNDALVDNRAFSVTPVADPAGQQDSVLAISLPDYLAAMAKAGLNPSGVRW